MTIRELKEEEEPESKSEKKEPLINGMPVDKYLRILVKERKTSENSTLVFK